MNEKKRVMLIGGTRALHEAVQRSLQDEYRLDAVPEGEAALRKARSRAPDLILLARPSDGELADIHDGLRSRGETRAIPIVVLVGLEAAGPGLREFITGVQDFALEPRSPEGEQELALRVALRLREAERGVAPEPEILGCGNLRLHVDRYEAVVGDKTIRLTHVECNLLKHFILNKDRVLTREKLLDAIWRGTHVLDRTVDVHLVTLRKKLADFDHVIATVYGAGYMLKMGSGEQVPKRAVATVSSMEEARVGTAS